MPALQGVPGGPAHHDDRGAGVDDVLQRRAGDGLELRRASVIDRLVQRGGVTIDGGRLRHLVLDDRLLRLRRARDRGEDVLHGAVVGDLRELARELIGGDEGPGTLGRGRAEPSAGDQHVRRLGVDLLEHVHVGVRHVEQARAGNGQVVRRPVGDDQFRRGGRDEDRRRRRVLERRLRGGVGGGAGQHVHLPGLGRGLCRRLDRGGDLLGHGPRPGQRGGGHEPVVHMEPIGVGVVPGQERGGVHHPHDGLPGDGHVFRRAVDRDQDARLRREDDDGRVVLDRHRLGRLLRPGWPPGSVRAGRATRCCSSPAGRGSARS